MNEKMRQLGTSPSAIRELFEYGKKRKAEIGEDNVFDFSIGNPSVPSPQVVNETLKYLIDNTEATKLHGYTSAVGDLNVRKAIKDYLNNKYNCNANESLIYLTAGAAASLTITLNAIINPGDEVIVLAPYFPEYKVFSEKANATVKVVNCNFDTFIPDFELLKTSISPKTKAVFINYPNNPTGVVLSKEDMAKLANVLKSAQKTFNSTIYLISDEPYRELVYGDIEVPYVTNYYDNTIVCYSFSKSLSLPGERIGYILVSSSCTKAADVYFAICGAGRSLGYVCAPALFQYMIPYCLGHTTDISVYEANRNILYDELTSYGYNVVKPDGAFYIFVKALEDDAVVFSKKAKEYELLLVPSDSFGIKGYVRISYCVTNKQVKDSLPSFKKLIESYKGE